MPAKYNLIYFTARALAEPIRWIFAQAGQEYEDFRIKDREEWYAYKPS